MPRRQFSVFEKGSDSEEEEEQDIRLSTKEVIKSPSMTISPPVNKFEEDLGIDSPFSELANSTMGRLALKERGKNV